MSEPYVILKALDLAQLADYVNKAIEQGYTPIGSPGILPPSSLGFECYQALVDHISVEVSQVRRVEIHGSHTNPLTSAELKARLASTAENVYVELEDEHLCRVIEIQFLSDPHRTVLRVDRRPVSFVSEKPKWIFCPFCAKHIQLAPGYILPVHNEPDDGDTCSASGKTLVTALA